MVLFIIKKATLEDQLHPMNFQKMIYKYSALVTIFKKDDLLNPLSTWSKKILSSYSQEMTKKFYDKLPLINLIMGN